MIKDFKKAMCQGCSIYLDKCCISDNPLVKDYIAFLAGNDEYGSDSEKFALHSGSECFEAACIVVSLLKSLFYNSLSNDTILSNLKIGEHVFYKNEAGIWRGTCVENGVLYGVIEGKCITRFPYQRYKHKLLRNNGGHTSTVAKRVKDRKEISKNFLSKFYDISVEQIPNEFDVALIILSNAEYLKNIYARIDVAYGKDGELVPLSILAPGANYTDLNNSYPFTKNGLKVDPVIKGVSKVENADNMVSCLTAIENKPVGLVVLGMEKYIQDTAFKSVIFNKKLRFSFVIGKLTVDSAAYTLKHHDGVIFSSTKEFLKNYAIAGNKCEVINTLQKQCDSIVHRRIFVDVKRNVFDCNEYSDCLKMLNYIRESSWEEREKVIFLRRAYSIIKFIFNLPVSYDKYKKHLNRVGLYREETSIASRIARLQETIIPDVLVKQAGNLVVKYLSMIANIAYENVLHDILKEFRIHLREKQKGLVVVDNKEMVCALQSYLRDTGYRVKVFDKKHYPYNEYFDAVFVVGCLQDRYFNILECYNTNTICVSLYGNTYYRFKNSKKVMKNINKELNKRMLLISDAFQVESEDSTDNVEKENADLSENLEDYLSQFTSLEFSNHVYSKSSYAGTIKPATVIASGVFESGELILFSQFYKAMVVDKKSGKVVEKDVQSLEEEDILIFGKNDSYTKNLIDELLTIAVSEGRLSSEMLQLSLYWKNALRDYMQKKNYSFSDISNMSKIYGSEMSYIKIRSWVVTDNHIVGPRKKDTLIQLAEMLKDDYLKQNVDEIFDACKIIRKARRTLLSAIGKTLVKSISGKMEYKDSLEEYISQYIVDKDLFRSLALNKISIFIEEKYANPSIVNRPIEDVEIL